MFARARRLTARLGASPSFAGARSTAKAVRRLIDEGLALVERALAARAHPPRRSRHEAFGAILQTVVPRALVFVDRAYARRTLDVGEPAIWRGAEPVLGDAPLSAPLEAHLQLTNRCTAGCQGCYTGASAEGAPNEWGLAEWTRAIDALADAGVFHVALGGVGEQVIELVEVVARDDDVDPDLALRGA